MNNLAKVPEVEEHMNKLHVQLAKLISKQRIQQGLTQSELVEIIKENGQDITQSQLSRIETGAGNINISTYEKVLGALGYESVEIMFKNQNVNRQMRQGYRKKKGRRKPSNRLIKADQKLIKS